MSALALRLRTWLWWLVPLVALALLLAIEIDWGRAEQALREDAQPGKPENP